MSKYVKEITKLYNKIQKLFPGQIKEEDDFTRCIDIAIIIIEKSKFMLDQQHAVSKAFEDVVRMNWLEKYIGKDGVIFRKTFLGKGIVIKNAKMKAGSFKTIRDAVDIISLHEESKINQGTPNKSEVKDTDSGAKK